MTRLAEFYNITFFLRYKYSPALAMLRLAEFYNIHYFPRYFYGLQPSPLCRFRLHT